MTKDKNRIQIVEDGAADPGAGPDLARFKPAPADAEAPEGETPEERRKRLERERSKRRRARGKGKSTTSAGAGELEVDLATCHFANAFILNLAGIVARRRIEPSPEQSDALDKSLQQIAQKYGGWLLEYAPEITYASTIVVLLATSPRVEDAPVQEVPDGAVAQE
jgi:hypothetical protein